MPNGAFIAPRPDAKGHALEGSAEVEMDEGGRSTVSGVDIAPASQEAAEALARTVRDLAATLPFGAEPLDFLSALEAEADQPGGDQE